jgi:hypothetical protein
MQGLLLHAETGKKLERQLAPGWTAINTTTGNASGLARNGTFSGRMTILGGRLSRPGWLYEVPRGERQH